MPKTMDHRAPFLRTAVAGLLALAACAAEPGDFLAVQSPAQPDCSYAIDDDAEGLTVSLLIAGVAGQSAPPEVTVGLAAQQRVQRTVAAVPEPGAGFRASARVRWSELTADGKPPADIRLAARAAWPSVRLQAPLRRERYLARDGAAPHGDLPADAADWTSVSLVEHRQALADRRAEIAITCTQPMTGRMSLVIEDGAGRRVRNLISGIDAAAGAQRFAWDGRDEDGNLVAPGSYRWRTLHHEALRAKYLTSFANGRRGETLPFGSNHNLFTSASANGKEIFLAAPMTEGGYAITAFDRAGAWTRGFNFPHGVPGHAVRIAADATQVVCINAGLMPGAAKAAQAAAKGAGKEAKAEPTDDGQVALSIFDIATGALVPFGKQPWIEIERYDARSGEPTPLTGLALLGDAVCVGSRTAGGIAMHDRATGTRRSVIAIPSVGPLCAAGPDLLVVSGDAVLRLPGGQLPAKEILRRPGHAFTGLAWDPREGGILVTDATDSQVIAYGADGGERRRYGVPGGAYAGPYQADRLVEPRGIAIADGLLWVTEERTVPKRAVAFDLASGAVADQRFGNPPYGGSGAGMDAADPHRWVGLGAVWRLDADEGESSALPTSLLFAKPGHFGGFYEFAYHYRFAHEAGRTFVLGAGFIQTVSELLPDGSLRDLAAFAAAGSWRYGCGWHPPEGFTTALAASGVAEAKSNAVPVLWVDANGDSRCQADEFQVVADGTAVAGTRWGMLGRGLGFTVGMRRADGAPAVLTLEPDGWQAGGVPRYPTLQAAIAAAKTATGLPQGSTGILAASATDRHGTTVFNSGPWMIACAADGAMRWRFRNEWVDVHGSHDAPLPETGVMQGNLFFLGCERFDDASDVVVINGNHGRHFVLTTDGLYVDELFRDVRMGGARDDQLVGGECFGGSFTRGADGRWYLQTGGDGFRIYEVLGLDGAVRASGAVSVTAEQLQAAERRRAAAIAATAGQRSAVLARRAAPRIDGDFKDWPAVPHASWDRQGRFKAETWLGWDDQSLYLAYHVADSSPWVNNGADWQSLFKTGDSVDLQLGIDPGADPRRRNPVPGDLRLLIAPSATGNQVVLYRHRLPPGASGTKVDFTSPWRSEAVADVRRLDGAKVAVVKYGSGYRVEASVPLADLAWTPKPDTALRADLGVIYGDDAGTVNLLRSYWSNLSTGLVNDVPGEIMLNPDRWGTLRMEGAP